MAAKKRKRAARPRSRQGELAGIPTDSDSLKKVGMGAAGAVAGAIVGSAIGKLGLLPGLALMGYGALNDNVACIAGGATLAMAPEAKNVAPSTKTGVAAYAETAVNRLSAAGKEIGRKAFLDKALPSVFADSTTATVSGVDYYDSAYANALNSIAGLSGDAYLEDGGDMGRLAEFGYQAAELNAQMSGIAGIDGTDDEEMAGLEGIRTSDRW